MDAMKCVGMIGLLFDLRVLRRLIVLRTCRNVSPPDVSCMLHLRISASRLQAVATKSVSGEFLRHRDTCFDRDLTPLNQEFEIRQVYHKGPRNGPAN